MNKLADEGNERMPEWFRLSDPELNGSDFKWLTLAVLRRLDVECPERADLSGCNRLKERVSEFRELWDWLVNQEIVSGPTGNCSLTLAGRRAYRKALDSAPNRYRAKVQSREGLRGNEARELVLRILRQHYTDYGERKLDQ